MFDGHTALKETAGTDRRAYNVNAQIQEKGRGGGGFGQQSDSGAYKSMTRVVQCVSTRTVVLLAVEE